MLRKTTRSRYEALAKNLCLKDDLVSSLFARQGCEISRSLFARKIGVNSSLHYQTQLVLSNPAFTYEPMRSKESHGLSSILSEVKALGGVFPFFKLVEYEGIH